MQRDLFGTATAAAMPDAISSKLSFLDRYRMSIRLDQALFLLIGLLVIYVLVFSFGVETGKRYAMAELKAERLKREQMVDELRDKVFSAQPVITQTVASDIKTGTSAPVVKQNTQNLAFASVPTPEDASRPDEARLQPIQTGTQVQNHKFTIQILTIASKAAAEKEVKRLTEKGMAGFIITRGKMSEVCVNGFDSHKQAVEHLKELKTQGVIPTDAYVRTLKS